MGGITLEEMSDEYFDVLKELGNIGAGNATTALSQMMQCKVDMSVPQVKLMEFKELGQLMGGEEIIMAGIYLAIEGDVAGSIMFLLEKQAARHLVNKLMGTSIEGEEFSDGIFSLERGWKYYYGSLSEFSGQSDESEASAVGSRSDGGYGGSDSECSRDRVWDIGG